MKKLYEKNELPFAIMWIVIYTVSMGNLRVPGDTSPLETGVLALICAVLFAFVKANGLTEKYGLSGWTDRSDRMLWLLPLWLIAHLRAKWLGYYLSVAILGSMVLITLPLTLVEPLFTV